MDEIIPVVNLDAHPDNSCKSRGCTVPRSQDDSLNHLPMAVRAKIEDHPCYSDEAHNYFARMHVPVASRCNIQCNYCNRKFDCANETRPGVVSKRLKPLEAVDKVLAVAKEIPELSVVGIAGPGDAFASAKQTMQTITELSRVAPNLKLCVSTNGLMLPEHVDELVAKGVEHVTVTINTLRPEVGAKIYAWIYYDGQRLSGEKAARILIGRQLEAVSMLTQQGVLVKVNTVYIPGINDRCIAEVSREIQQRGAFVHNVMPLISKPEFGTAFSKAGQREPTAAELDAVREESSGGIQIMKHCRLCRADAIGRLGQDKRAMFESAGAPSVAEPRSYDSHSLLRYKQAVTTIRSRRRALRESVDLSALDSSIVRFYVVATTGDSLINLHFGHAQEFLVFRVDPYGCSLHSRLEVEQYCANGHGKEGVLLSLIDKLKGYDGIFVAKIGRKPRLTLQAAGINIITDYAHQDIEYALRKHTVELLN
ncbi:nitrogenase cofactor biosynthesis protein NifB [Photobacterium lutimaris]|uniref:Nitrogenase cofactor biosynthesis protein NifB n=1 Tax=Photobacterium lutimaris TaxID=388278 RepID=A0A2T3J344_9GAMM|nr:nitrogenase cofactor biosynthesis protein NifB [Photobacterium lutimaris]PSU35722.1 nitrogenase cofactor biosynthesis protein NifB [Photobacterium lutimaris]TDR78785.1 nitrogen fixation protein NifB [Photobacterium lutimaris]